MWVRGLRVVVVLVVGLALIAVAVVPFLVVPLLAAAALSAALILRTEHPAFSRAWMLAGLTIGLIAAGVGAYLLDAPQTVVTILLVLCVPTYAGSVVLFAHAWSRGSDHPRASWVSAVSLGLVGLLCVVGLGSFGRGIALADQGNTSLLVDLLFLVSTVGIPTFLAAGLIATPIARRRRGRSLTAR